MSDIQPFDFSVNLTRALLWRHNNAQALQSLITQKNAWYLANHTQFWQNWVRDVFDLRTCNAFGLQVWATILGISIHDPIPNKRYVNTWGFGPKNQNFGNGNFCPVTQPVTYLTTDQQRLLLQLRYFKLTSRCTTPAINRMLKFLLRSNGSGYVLDGGNMTMKYIFNLPIGSDLAVVLENYDVLPRPAAVGVKYFTRTKCFGFGSFNQNFNRGTFLS